MEIGQALVLDLVDAARDGILELLRNEPQPPPGLLVVPVTVAAEVEELRLHLAQHVPVVLCVVRHDFPLHPLV